MVRQEIWFLLAHYAISALICGRPPRLTSTRTGSSSGGPCGSSAAGSRTRRPFPPEQQQRILAAVIASITRKKHLNSERRHRSYLRVVKRARHNSFRVKKTGDTGTRHDGPATIKLVNLPAASHAA